MATLDPFNSKRELSVGGHYFSLDGLDENGIDTSTLPYSIRILLEGALRCNDGFLVSESDIPILQIGNLMVKGDSIYPGLFFKILLYRQLLI